MVRSTSSDDLRSARCSGSVFGDEEESFSSSRSPLRLRDWWDTFMAAIDWWVEAFASYCDEGESTRSVVELRCFFDHDDRLGP